MRKLTKKFKHGILDEIDCQKTQFKRGFSIIELAIVLIIISTLVGAILGSGRLISGASVATARSLTKSSPVIDNENLILWLETTMLQSFDQSEADDGQNISVWKDLSNNENNASGSGSYIENGINDLPIISFDGSSDYFTFDGASLVNKNYSIFVVERRSDDSANNYFIGGNGTANSNEILSLGYKSDNKIGFEQYDNNYEADIAAFAGPITNIHSFRFSSIYGKNFYLNGAEQTLNVSGSANEMQGLVKFDNAQIGRFLSNNYYSGEIGEIIIFGKYLSDNERQDVEGYLTKKWGD